MAVASAPRRAAPRETPIRRQFEALKRQHPGCLLLFQLGDFFESFEEDARIVAHVCGVTLTSRELGKGDRVPLAGVPVTRLEHYLARLIEAGIHVAVAEQVSPAGAGLVEREVTRVVTPGTIAEPGLLREKENNYLAALLPGRGGVGLAYVDVSTGEFAVAQLEGDDAPQRLRAELERLGPAEVLLPEGHEPDVPPGPHRTVCQPWRFHEPAARERLCARLGVASLEGFGCAHLPLAVGAAGAILSYLEENNSRLVNTLAGIRTYSTVGGMALDGYTRRNLELLKNGRTGRVEGSLLGVLDRTRTPMGGRLLRRWIAQPLLDRAQIERRLDGVAELLADDALRAHLRALLARVGDLERLTGRVAQGVATARELLDLASALGSVAPLPGLAERLPGALGDHALDACPDVADLIARAVAPPQSGRRVRPGYAPELDEIVGSIARSRRFVADLERRERERTGIRSLKVGYTKVFGYFIEVTRPNLKSVPIDFQRKQTLAHAERFVTPELKECEARILEAEQLLHDLEQEAFEGILRDVATQGPRLRRLAAALAQLDVFAALAEVAHERGYCRPVLDDGDEIELVDSRHPVVEATAEPGTFIPNDCRLGGGGPRVVLLTGPNMAGKSTYLRQVALIVLMAQMGSYVPAGSARIGIVDRVFTRVGAQDDIAAGASTFMVEMMEAASILRHATDRSLVVLDEIGRGTSTFDGLSIARAVVEELHDHVGARALFATHFHELAALEAQLPRARAFNVAVSEADGDVVFLRRVVPGAADRSYGIHVAKLAGLPARVTSRAAEVLSELETPREPPSALLTELRALDVDALTPLEALVKLADLKKRAR